MFIYSDVQFSPQVWRERKLHDIHEFFCGTGMEQYENVPGGNLSKCKFVWGKRWEGLHHVKKTITRLIDARPLSLISVRLNFTSGRF